MRTLMRRMHDRKTIGLLAGILLCGAVMGITTAHGEEEQERMYGIGSTSKVFVSASVMKLSEEGRINLDAPLTDYLPEFEMKDSRYRKITPRMLLNHSSGLQGSTLTNAMLLGEKDTDNHDHLLERLKTQRLKGEPGAWAVYCNDGFTLAEILVERVSGMTYTEYLEKEMWDPLGIEHVKTPQSQLKDGCLASIYDRNTGKELPPEYPNVIGSGGLFATAEDLCRLSAIFMHGDGGGSSFLSKESLEAMETDRYSSQTNPDGRDSAWSYGLGWDSVSGYPFHRYGIKALTKGGSTSYYRSSLTVLPEENISCAVLTSGGDSGLNQIVVQEIMMEYLEEIGRIQRKEEHPFAAGDEAAAASVPDDLLKYGGWYAGRDMMEVEIKKNGTLSLSSRGLKEGITQTYQYGNDGRFYGISGDYLNTMGELERGSNGKIGRTALEFLTDGQGKTYLTAATYESYPGLGSTADYLPVAEKVEERQAEEALMEAWEERQGKEYYLVNETYSSTAYSTNFSAKVKVLSKPAGYLLFEQSMMAMARLTEADKAEFFLELPGQMGRDLYDYRIIRENGKEYLDSGSARMIADENLEMLPDPGEDIIIGQDGEAIWFLTAGQQVEIHVPEKGAFYVYNHGGREMTCVSSSYVLEPGQNILLPRDGRIAFVGEPGVKFSLEP